ncbi:MAG: hypothetical protein JO236_07075 [Mycobacterium sp.]|uniref:hypothetical protein n=1 Tax=Mycobacterium sp. TaxID=1785 RepID=UPI001ED150C1|nr:hypothetical protein [Mycobacterium sp.]
MLVNPVCPLNCRLRRDTVSDDATGDRVSSADQVEWAGLLVNLDLAFSSRQRDKVYVQHLNRKRAAQLRWLPQHSAAPCVCGLETDDGHVDRRSDRDAANSMSSR